MEEMVLVVFVAKKIGGLWWFAAMICVGFEQVLNREDKGTTIVLLLIFMDVSAKGLSK